MTEQEEIEYIVNAAYLRGCDSNFKNAIAAMQESEKHRLSYTYVLIGTNGEAAEFKWQDTYVAVRVYSTTDDLGAASEVNKSTTGKERNRLAELVRLIKEEA